MAKFAFLCSESIVRKLKDVYAQDHLVLFDRHPMQQALDLGTGRFGGKPRG